MDLRLSYFYTTNWFLCDGNRSSRPEVFYKKDVLKNFLKFLGKRMYQSFFLNKVAGLKQACNSIKKETLALVFHCEFCEILKSTFLQNTPSRFYRCNMSLKWVKVTLKISDDSKSKEKLYEVRFGICKSIYYPESLFNTLYIEIKQKC